MLLATYYGANYLQEFLDSLADQRDVSIHLIVSDDGSTDETLRIVDKNKSRFNSVKILEGPKLGTGQNFFHLLRHSTSDFAAFADQDDIWGKDHLALSIQRLLPHESMPAMSFTSTTQFFESGRRSSVWPTFREIPQLPRMYIECCARGCTVALNKSAVSLVNTYRPKFAVMHDWWCLLIMKTCGIVIYESTPEINYRIHSANTIGLGNRSVLNTLRNIQQGKWQPYMQLVEFYQSFGQHMRADSRTDIKRFIDALEGSLSERVVGLVISRTRFRESLYNEMRTRVAFLLFPLIFEVGKNSTKL